MTDSARVAALLAEMDERRAAFLAALDALDATAAARPLVAGWDARDLAHHVAFWSNHGADAVALATAGRGGAFDYRRTQTDAMNARATAAGRRLTLEAARREEAEAFARFRQAVAALTDDRLDERLGNGDRVEDVIRYDGPDHYAEHAVHLGGVPAPA
ncbi:MAG TPA: maleylpyruvate isomerase N-terminal domain-containing protein [candidate division Zixibacteria bacterium]|nr:maleylpyruvate isomerase N-terminal domain-containing protein [candidate division Zixibacteria bacterium]